MYYEIIRQMAKHLRNLSAILEKAEAHAASVGFESDNYLGLRLAPNMLPFSAQLRIASDNAKSAAAGLSGKTPPVFEDTEKTWSEYKARLVKTVEYLDTFQKSDFEGAAERKITSKFFGDKHMVGHEFIIERAFPNFLFHVTTAYDLLRLAGVQLGKADFLGPQPLHS